MIDFLGAMTALDFLFILTWVGVIFFGARAGMVKVLFLIAAIVAGAVGGPAMARPLSQITGPWAGVSAERGLPVTYFLMTVLTIFVVFLVLMLTYRSTRIARSDTLEGIIGGVVGFMAGLILIAQITGMLLVATAEPWAYLDGARENIKLELTTTPFIPFLAQMFPSVTGGVAQWLPVSVESTCDRCL